MTRTLIIGCVLLGAATLASAQPVPLRPNLAAGQSWKFTDLQTTDSNNTATMNGQSQQFASKSKQQRGGTAEVLAVANGVPTSMRITFDKDCTATNEFNGQTQTMPYPFAGQTITLTRSPDGRVQDDFKGQVDPTMSAELHAILDRDAVVSPGKPVSVGDEWSADPAVAGRVLQLVGQDTGGITLKLMSVDQVGGKPVASVKMSFAVIKSMNGMEAKLVAQGIDLVDLSTGHVIKTDLKGTADVTGKQQTQGPDGQAASFDVAGKGVVTITSAAPFSGGGMPAPVAPPPMAGGPGPGLPPGPAIGGNPLSPSTSPFVGTFSDGKLKVDLKPAGDAYEGTFTLGGQTFPAHATNASNDAIKGSFTAGGKLYAFDAQFNGDVLTLISGSTTYQLKKAAANPLDGPPPNPLSP